MSVCWYVLRWCGVCSILSAVLRYSEPPMSPSRILSWMKSKFCVVPTRTNIFCLKTFQVHLNFNMSSLAKRATAWQTARSRSNKPDILLTDSQSNASLGCRNKIWKFENLKNCERNNGRCFEQVFFRHRSWKTTLTTKTLLKALLFGCPVGKKWCLEKGIANEIENYELTRLKTLLERS